SYRTERQQRPIPTRRSSDLLEAGDEPFGTILVSADGDVLFEDRTRVASGDNTQHSEFAIARWAAANLSPEERAVATTYTSGEHRSEEHTSELQSRFDLVCRL